MSFDQILCGDDFFWNNQDIDKKIYLNQVVSGANSFSEQNFFEQIFLRTTFVVNKFFLNKIFFTYIFKKNSSSKLVFSCEATLDNTQNVTNSLTNLYRNSLTSTVSAVVEPPHNICTRTVYIKGNWNGLF